MDQSSDADEMPSLPRGENIDLNEFQAGDQERDTMSPESGIVLETGETNYTDKTDKTLTNIEEVDTARDRPEPNMLLNFDLANPEAITYMLENVELTDEDTDVLLQEAYNINMKLKEILRRRENGDSLDPSEEALLQEQTVVVVPSSAVGPRAVTAGAPIRDATFAKNEPLPPIKSTDTNCDPRVMSALYSAKLNRRPVPPSSAMKSRAGASGVPPSANIHGKHRPGSGSQPAAPGSQRQSASSTSQRRSSLTSKGKKREVPPVPIEERPPWNDRYN